MDENAKEYLYEQLEQIVQCSVKEDKEELISKEKFMEMTGAECLRYVFEYRDNNEPYEFNGEKGEAYIQIPNIDLSNEDLNDVILRGFILSHPENDDEVISSINFANTGITLDLNSILENKTEQTGTTNKRIIDFSQCNFEGCTIYGILPDEYQSETAKITDGYEVRGREKLGEEYTERREKLHDVQAPKTLSRRAYERLIDGKDFSRLNGITDATEIHLEDFDFDTNDEQGLGEMYQTLYGELETRENLNGIYTNMNLSSEFIKNTFQKLTSDYAKGKFLQELIRQGKELDFVKEKFESLQDKDKSQVLEELVRQGKEFEFAFENAIYIQDEETKKKVKEQAQQRGISEAKIEWQLNSNVDNLLECIDEDIDFVKENFESLANKDKNQVLQELIRRGEHQELVNEYWRYIEGNETIEINSNQFRNIIGCGEKESKELIKLMESTQINLTNLIRKKAILASCGIDIKDALKNRTLMQTSPVVLYAKKRYYESVGQPTNISNLGMSRAKFENMSGKTLTCICNEYVFSDRYDNLKDTVVEEINKEIQEQKEKKAKQSKNMPNQQQSRIEAKSNSKAHKVNPVVSTFLQTQVGISETQEQKLGEWLQRFNYDIYSQNVEEDLALKKQILDQFGVTSQAFGMSCKILTIPLKTLYARAQFLKDIGEKVTPANLMATLGANGDIFAQKYGSYFMEEKSEQDAQYIINVENATNENYPMPKTKEEIIRKIKEMEEKQK